MDALVINMIASDLERLRRLVEEMRDESIEAVFVLGNVVEPAAHLKPSAWSTAAEQTYSAALALLSELGVSIYLIPGEHDPSLATISHVVQAYQGRAKVHLVHRTAAALGTNNAVAGFGGRLSQDNLPSDASVHFPAWEARVAFQHLRAYNDLFRGSPRRIMLFAMPPRGARIDKQDAEATGVALLNSLLRAYQPALVCCGGPAQGRGVEMIDGTPVVNPGWLTEGSYALVDLDQMAVRLGHLPEPIAAADTFRSIVVALDGSPQAWRALELAASFARRDGAKLTLVYAWDPVGASRGHPFLDDTVARRIAVGEHLLAAARRCLPEMFVEEEILEGPPAPAILRVADAHRADLIVMGARRMGAIRAALGSVSHAVLQEAPCPVLIAREGPRNPMLLDLGATVEVGQR